MDNNDRLERIEASLQSTHQKIDAILTLLSRHTRPLQVMEDHVHNVEAVAAHLPFLNRLPFSSRKSITCASHATAEETQE